MEDENYDNDNFEEDNVIRKFYYKIRTLMTF